MPHRHRSLTTITMVLAAFAIVAMHVGTADHPMTMTAMEVSASHHASPMPTMAHTVDVMQSAAGESSSRTTTAHDGHQGSCVMTIVMMCQLLLLATAVGYVVHRLVARRSIQPAERAPSMPVLEHPRRGLRPSRPPGLTMLCVAIC